MELQEKNLQEGGELKMIKLKKQIIIQEWDYSITHKYFYLLDDEIVSLFSMKYNKNEEYAPLFGDFWVVEKYRNMGISHLMMKDLIELDLDLIECLVHKDNWVHKLYEKYGFYIDEKADENYYWMKKTKDKL